MRQRSCGLRRFHSAIPSRLFSELLILRFIILYLFTRLWGLAEDVIQTVFPAGLHLIIGGLILKKTLDNLTSGNMAMYGYVVASKIPDSLYWLFTFALAWPLHTDVNRALGLKFVDYVPWKGRTRSVSLSGEQQDHANKGE